MFSILRCSACCRPCRTRVTLNRFLTIFEAFVPHFHLCCTHCIIPESLLNHSNRFCGGMFKPNAEFDADSMLYSLSHFECISHTAHMRTQQHLPPPLTGTVKSLLFTHVHSSPLNVAHTALVTLTIAGLFLDRTIFCSSSFGEGPLFISHKPDGHDFYRV